MLKFGNKNLTNSNKVISYYFIFVSFMQLIDYFIWSDIECKKGINEVISIIGPFFNYLQPVLYIILLNKYVKSNNFFPNNIIKFINIIYLIYFSERYITYINKHKNNLCSKLDKDNHISWKWSNYNIFNYYIYLMLVFVNILNYTNNEQVKQTVIISFLLLFVSYKKYNNVMGELWCLMVTSVPLLILIMQKLK